MVIALELLFMVGGGLKWYELNEGSGFCFYCCVVPFFLMKKGNFLNLTPYSFM